MRTVNTGSPDGDSDWTPEARNRAFMAIHAVLRDLVDHTRRGDDLDSALQACKAWVHEVYPHLGDRPPAAASLAEWAAVAAGVMRLILIQHARRRIAEQRLLPWHRVQLDDRIDQIMDTKVNLLDLDQTLRHLEAETPDQARVVDLRYFAGLSPLEIARIMTISERSVMRLLSDASGKLKKVMHQDE